MKALVVYLKYIMLIHFRSGIIIFRGLLKTLIDEIHCKEIGVLY